MRNPSCQVPMGCKVAWKPVRSVSGASLETGPTVAFLFQACLWSQTACNSVCSLLPLMLLRQIVSRRKRTLPKAHWYGQSLFFCFCHLEPGVDGLRTSCFDLAGKEQELEVTVGFQKRNLSGTWKSSTAQHPRPFNSLLARVLFEAKWSLHIYILEVALPPAPRASPIASSFLNTFLASGPEFIDPPLGSNCTLR